jgi:hypothetical protein
VQDAAQDGFVRALAQAVGAPDLRIDRALDVGGATASRFSCAAQ